MDEEQSGSDQLSVTRWEQALELLAPRVCPLGSDQRRRAGVVPRCGATDGTADGTGTLLPR